MTQPKNALYIRVRVIELHVYMNFLSRALVKRFNVINYILSALSRKYLANANCWTSAHTTDIKIRVHDSGMT